MEEEPPVKAEKADSGSDSGGGSGSDSSADSSDEEVVKKKNTKKASIFVENEASEESGDDKNDSADEEGDAKNEYDMNDGFIAAQEDDSDDSDDSDSDDGRRSKKKKRDMKRLKRGRDTLQLEDDDMELVRENMGLQTADDSTTKRARMDDAMDGDETRDTERNEEDYDSDNMDNFIVDDTPDGPADRAPAPISATVAPTDAAIREQVEMGMGIFGEGFEDFMAATQAPTADDDEEAVWVENKQQEEKQVSIRANYEPDAVRHAFLTEKDDQIRKADIPERLQDRQFSDQNKEQLAAEADWIYSQLNLQSTNSDKQVKVDSEAVRDAIQAVLKYIREDKLEVPFIYCYRQEYLSVLQLVHLWKIFDLDQDWDSLLGLKAAFKEFLASVGQTEASIDKQYLAILQSNDERSIRDLRGYLQLLYGEQTDKSSDGDGASGKHRRAGRRNFYRTCVRANLGNVAQQFALTASQFGECLTRGERVYPVPTPTGPVGDFGVDYVGNSPEFKDEKAVLQGASMMLAAEIAEHPVVRSKVRELYRQNTTLCTTPTIQRKYDIDPFHSYFGVHHINAKPVMELLDNPEYLKMVKAKTDGYINIDFQDPPEITFMDIMEPVFLSEGGVVDPEWDPKRSEVLRYALKRFLLPMLKRELEAELLKTAQEAVAVECTKKLRALLQAGPFYAHADEFGQRARSTVTVDGTSRNGFHLRDDPRYPTQYKIVAVSVSDERNDANYAVVLDPDGRVLNHCTLPADRAQLAPRMENFIKSASSTDCQVQAVVVNNSGGVHSRSVFNQLDQMIPDLMETLTEQWEEEDEQRGSKPNIKLTYANDEVAQIFAQSPRGNKEFPDFPANLKQAISLGRYLRDPLTELAGLWTEGAGMKGEMGRELLMLDLHPLQSDVGRELLVKYFEREFIDEVRSCGVDINLAARQDHAGALLQFVAGLGPRKAQALRRAVTRHGRLTFRTDLLKKQMLGDCVFRNAAGFLRVREDDADTFEEYGIGDLLDDTRIHPESYELAVKMCIDAQEDENEEADDNMNITDPQEYNEHVLKIMFNSQSELKKRLQKHVAWKPVEDEEIDDLLATLDLEDYARMLEEENKGMKFHTLNDIKNELRFPFMDKRKMFADPSHDDLFYMLTGESPSTIQVGQLVTARVTELRDRFAWCTLESGMRASIQLDNLPGSPDDGQTAIEVDDTFECRILALRKDRFQVEVTCLPTQMDNGINNRLLPENATYDYHFDITKALEDYKKGKSGPEEKKTAQKRTIAHPSFKNASRNQVEALLKQLGVGESMFRPSKKGLMYLVLTWQYCQNKFMHLEVEEQDDQDSAGNVMNPSGARLAPQLKLFNNTYESLDEIIARCIAPMNDYVEEITTHEKFRDQTREDVEDELRSLKKRTPKRIPYLFLHDPKNPGYYCLLWLPRMNVKKDVVSLKPNGYKLRNIIHPDLKGLINWFKQHCNDRPAASAPRAHPGAHTGAYNSASWRAPGGDGRRYGGGAAGGTGYGYGGGAYGGNGGYSGSFGGQYDQRQSQYRR